MPPKKRTLAEVMEATVTKMAVRSPSVRRPPTTYSPDLLSMKKKPLNKKKATVAAQEQSPPRSRTPPPRAVITSVHPSSVGLKSATQDLPDVISPAACVLETLPSTRSNPTPPPPLIYNNATFSSQPPPPPLTTYPPPKHTQPLSSTNFATQNPHNSHSATSSPPSLPPRLTIIHEPNNFDSVTSNRPPLPPLTTVNEPNTNSNSASSTRPPPPPLTAFNEPNTSSNLYSQPPLPSIHNNLRTHQENISSNVVSEVENHPRSIRCKDAEEGKSLNLTYL